MSQLARIPYAEAWDKATIDRYMALIPHRDGMALLTMDELRDLLATLWMVGKED